MENNFDDTTGLSNPIFELASELDYANNNNNNNNNLDITGMQNPMNSLNNSNNLGDSTIINPFFGNMNQGQNLDDMLNEMSKVLLNFN